MHEVAKPRADALPHFVLAAARFPEVSDGRELGINGPSAEPAVVQVFDSTLCVLFSPKLDVDVAHQVVTQVVTHVHLFHLPVFVLGLQKTVFEEIVVVFLHLFVRD